MTDSPATRDTYCNVALYRLAHSRTGDKGNIANISVIAWNDACYPWLVEQLTDEAVACWFRLRQPSRVQRYRIDTLCALNFVIHDVLDGGVNEALNLDGHGKALSFFLLDFPLRVPTRLADGLPDLGQPAGP